MLTIAPHPLLECHTFVTHFPQPLGALTTPAEISALFSLTAAAPLRSDDTVRETIRVLLRHGGFKPTGRSKPASEYLLKAATEQKLATINLAVDVCNAVSLHSGLPISVIDLDRANEPLSIAIAPAGASYIFNASGQTIDLAGLLCLCDAEGPCANAVKDAQRTKTHPGTTRTLSVIWSSVQLPGRGEKAAKWYRELLQTAGATIVSE
ncbi:MAG: phenylalanine--tRNA ligase beta subunit-related protein [Planctomycetota bacterium]